MPEVKFNELNGKVSATLGRAAGKRSWFLSVVVGAYQIMSKTFTARLDLEKHKTPTWKHRELIIVFLIRYPASTVEANKIGREKTLQKCASEAPRGKKWNKCLSNWIIAISFLLELCCEDQQTHEKLLSSIRS